MDLVKVGIWVWCALAMLVTWLIISGAERRRRELVDRIEKLERSHWRRRPLVVETVTR